MTITLRDRLERIAAARALIRDIEGRDTRTHLEKERVAGDGGSGSSGREEHEGWDRSSTREARAWRGVPQPKRPETPTPGRTRDPRHSIIEQRLSIDSLGLEVVGRSGPDPLTLAHLGLRGEPPRRWEDICFLDTETTGLSSGAGTYVFMLGTAWIADGEVVLRQHVLNDLGAEREFVATFHRELDAFRACASYNGKSFDLPILRARVVLALRGELSVDESHLDLLHPARRLWKDRFGSTTLRQIEASVLDDPRVDDIPGALIPDRYFHYLRTRDERIIAPVLRHNAKDVLSLVRIMDRVARAVIDARGGRAPDHAPAALALARVFERTGEGEPAFWCYESAFVDGQIDVRVKAALPFARALEARGEIDRAIRLLETLVDLGAGPPSWREQAEARLRRLLRRRWRQEKRAS